MIIPFSPRADQRKIHSMLERKYSRNIIIAHRRYGKTHTIISNQIKAAIKKNKSIHAYSASSQSRALKICWNLFIKLIPHNIIKYKSKFEGLIQLKNNSELQIHSLRNPTLLRGLEFDSLAIDEYDEIKELDFSESIFPTLIDREGSLCIIGTPKPVGNIAKAYEKYKNNSNWNCLLLPNSKTNVLKKEHLDYLRQELSHEQFNQEIECSFDAPNILALLREALPENQSDLFSPKSQVHTCWDIGYTDLTVIYFIQVDLASKNPYRIIRCYSDSGKDIEYYFDLLRGYSKQFNYNYGYHFVPHDMDNHNFLSKYTGMELARKNGFNFTLAPNVGEYFGISHLINKLSKSLIDKNACDYQHEQNHFIDGYRALLSYSGVARDPYAHYVDALRIGFLSVSKYMESEILKDDLFDFQMRKYQKIQMMKAGYLAA